MQTTSSLRASLKLRRLDFVSMVLFLGSVSRGKLCNRTCSFLCHISLNKSLDPNETL